MTRAEAATVTWDAGETNTTNGWITATFSNWSGNTTPAGQDVVFTNIGAVSSSSTVSSTVNSNVSINSLLYQYNSTSDWHVTEITSGNTLTVGGASSVFTVGGFTSNSKTVTQTAFKGDGALAISQSGGTIFVGNNRSNVIDGAAGSSNSVAVLDMHELASFSADLGSTGNFMVGSAPAGKSGSWGGRAEMRLAKTNVITANKFYVGSFDTANVNLTRASQDPSVLFLGVTNTIKANDIWIGSGPANSLLHGKIAFDNSVLASNPVVTIRAADGSSRVSTFYVGMKTINGTGGGVKGVADFSGGEVDILSTSMIIGQGASGNANTTEGIFIMDKGTVDTTGLAIGLGWNSGAAPSPATTGTLTINGGTFIAGAITNGGTGTNNYGASAGSVIGTINVNNNGTLKTGTLKMAESLRNSSTNTAPITSTLNISNTATVEITNGGITMGVVAGTSDKANLSATINLYGGSLTVGGNIAEGVVSGQTTNPTSTINLDGGKLDMKSNSITVDSFNVKSGIIANLGQLSGGSTNLVKTTAGTLVLLGNNTYTGNTVINDGVVSLGDGGTNGQMAGKINIANAGTIFRANRSDNFTLTNEIIGSGIFQQTGAGTTTFTGTNTYSGGTLISSGGLQLGNGGASGSVSGDITNNAVLNINRNNALTLSGLISGTGTLQQIGTGTTSLTAANTYSGGTLISSGGLSLGDGGASGSVAGNITNNANLLVNRSDNVTLTNLISGTGAFTQLGAGTTTLTADNTYSGLTTIEDGALQIGNGGTTGWVAGVITNNSKLIYNRSDNITISTLNAFLGTEDSVFVKRGAGTLTIINHQTGNKGTYLIEEGTLKLGDGNTTPSLGTNNITNNSVLVFQLKNGYILTNVVSGTGSLISSGNNLTLISDNTYTGGTIISNSTFAVGTGGSTGWVTGDVNIASSGAAFRINRGDNVTVSNIISGTTGVFYQGGAGTTTLTASNTFTGTTSITNGALRIGDGGTTGWIDSIITNSAVLIYDRSDNISITGNNIIRGSATSTLVKRGANTMTIAGDIDNHNGTILIEDGTLNIGGGIAGVSMGSGNITNNGMLVLQRTSANLAMANLISGTGSLVQAGSGTISLTADNTYTGGTIISNNVLSLGNGGTSGSVVGDINITNAGAALLVNRSDNVTLTNTLSGAGNFGKLGTGTTTLTADNTFSGTNVVAGGTLALNASSGAALGQVSAVIVGSSATLLLSKSDQVKDSATVTLSGGTIHRESGVSEVFGNLNLTAASFLDYGSGTEGTLAFGTYTPSSLLTVNNFFEGNKLVFSSNLTSQVTNGSFFSFDNAFTHNWDGSSSTFTITAIPEPSTYLAAAGLIGLMLLWRRRTKRA